MTQMLTALQQALKRAGFDPGREDGRVDNRMMDAVRAFRQAKNLPMDADRYIDIATVRRVELTRSRRPRAYTARGLPAALISLSRGRRGRS
jgi:peptidoglycan hydrolase-like protein with peptidoglycan-binding domain